MVPDPWLRPAPASTPPALSACLTPLRSSLPPVPTSGVHRGPRPSASWEVGEGRGLGHQSPWGRGHRRLSEDHFLYPVGKSQLHLPVNLTHIHTIFCLMTLPHEPLIPRPHPQVTSSGRPQVTSSGPAYPELTSTSWPVSCMTGQTRMPRGCWGGSGVREGRVSWVSVVGGSHGCVTQGSQGSNRGHRIHRISGHEWESPRGHGVTAGMEFTQGS